MSQFQIIASIIMLIIIFLAVLPKIFANKDDSEGLSSEEKDFLYPERKKSTENQSLESQVSDAEFAQTMPFDVIEAIRSGNLILAIKNHRDQFGTNLKTSKDAVIRMAKILKQ